MPALSILMLSLAAAPSVKIAQVVVYPDRAQVTRAQNVACGARAVASFEGIPPAADPASFRARASGGTVEGLRSEERTRADAFAPAARDLDQSIRKLEGDLRALRDTVRRAAGSTNVAAGYGEVALALVAREMNDAAPNTKAWNGAFDTALATRQKAIADQVDAEAKVRAINYQLDDLRRQRARVAASSSRKEWAAEVLVSCPAGQTAQVELTYMVGGASWAPSYEARADEGAGMVELATYATVTQSTGENWSATRVILSTAVPRQDATPPRIAPLRLWAEERKAERKVIVRREELHDHAESSGESTISPPTGGVSGVRGDQGGLRAASQGLSVQLQVPEASEVPGDGSPARLFVGRTKLRAKFALRAVPKLGPFAFRVADVTNAAPFPLLAGPLDAFRKGGLIARYPIERVAEGAPFHLTFGIDDSVRIKRITVEEIERDKNFLGLTRRFHYKYRYELANYLAGPQELEMSDHLPVSELDDVKVAFDEQTSGGYQLRADDGIVTWKVKLAPGEKRNLMLAFHVDVPSSYDSGGM